MVSKRTQGMLSINSESGKVILLLVLMLEGIEDKIGHSVPAEGKLRPKVGVMDSKIRVLEITGT